MERGPIYRKLTFCKILSAGLTDGARFNVSLPVTYFSQNSLSSLTGPYATNLRSDTLSVSTTANSETQVPTSTFTPSSYRLTESLAGPFRSSRDSDISFVGSVLTIYLDYNQDGRPWGSLMLIFPARKVLSLNRQAKSLSICRAATCA